MRVDFITPDMLAEFVDDRGHVQLDEWVVGTRCMISLRICGDEQLYVSVALELSGSVIAKWYMAADVLPVHCMVEQLRERARQHPLRLRTAAEGNLWR